MTTTIRHLIIHGRVQGVGFRAWVADAARQRKLSGWVRNRKDGTVEAVFSGSEHDVAAMVVVCRSGPPASKVTRIVEREAGIGELAAADAPDGFVSLPTI